MGSRIIVVGANTSLEPYKRATEETTNLKAELEKMGFEVREEEPTRKIGFRPAVARAESK